MLIRIIALHSPSTSLGYTNKILEGDIAQTNFFGSAATYMGARNKVKQRLRATQMRSHLALGLTKTQGT
jgi:hypothetical protein